MSVKIQFRNECKKIKKPANFQALIASAHKSFGDAQLPPRFKFFYFDSENDMISLSNQEDLEEAYASNPTSLKLMIEESVDTARMSLDLDQSFKKDFFAGPPITSSGLNTARLSMASQMIDSPFQYPYIPPLKMPQLPQQRDAMAGPQLLTSEMAIDTCNI